MEYIVNHIPIKVGKRSGRNMSPTFLTIHSTANKSSTAMNERNWLVNPSNERVASFHVAVDEHMAVEVIPFNEPSIHSGSSKGNASSIGLEICESGNRQKTLDNAIKLSAKILDDYGWGIDKLVRHYDWSGKNCPGILSANNWELWRWFKQEVYKQMNKPKVKVEDKPLSVPDWAKSGQEYVIKNGISDGARPFDTATRMEVWSMIERMSK